MTGTQSSGQACYAREALQGVNSNRGPKKLIALIAAIVSSQPPPISSVQTMTPAALDHRLREVLLFRQQSGEQQVRLRPRRRTGLELVDDLSQAQVGRFVLAVFFLESREGEVALLGGTRAAVASGHFGQRFLVAGGDGGVDGGGDADGNSVVDVNDITLVVNRLGVCQ